MLTERPPESPEIDRDAPELRVALAVLAGVLSRQLLAVADDLHGSTCSPWQAIAVAGRLDRLRAEVDYLRRDVAKFRPVEANE